ncbi:MAG: DUF4160 domain-containing protein [Candidatus Kapabacteria bacterium]|nr:DUF4160 domain-containing protein [Candidatus Kapabacteria bacterium]
MPQIAYFFGIKILMNFNDHNPPHFEAWYGEHRATIGFDPITVLAGSLPPRVLSLVIEWTMLHTEELRDNWERRSRKEPLFTIRGLDQ